MDAMNDVWRCRINPQMGIETSGLSPERRKRTISVLYDITPIALRLDATWIMLRVTKLTDYATVVLMVLASAPEVVLSATGLAERAGLEAPTVAKLLKPLAQAGLVQAFRGAAGGYRLARPAAGISLVEIVEAMEGPLAITECSTHDGHCGIEQSCGARANWRRINDIVADSLRRITLADMAQPVAETPLRKAIPVSLSAN